MQVEKQVLEENGVEFVSIDEVAMSKRIIIERGCRLASQIGQR
jgi:hypothetical protein